MESKQDLQTALETARSHEAVQQQSHVLQEPRIPSAALAASPSKSPDIFPTVAKTSVTKETRPTAVKTKERLTLSYQVSG